jgi:hypothetical protein
VSLLDDLHAHLQAADPLLAGAAREPSDAADTAVGDAAAAGDPAYGLTVEAVREGQLVHTGRGRVIDGADADLAILAGDHLYAFGLGRLAANGDLPSVAALADTIAACAQAHAEGAPDRAVQAWSDGAARIAARDRAR